MEWRTIETAPKDVEVLLYCPAQGCVRGRWDDDKYNRKPRPYWKNDRTALFGINATRADQPTHWIPLPDPPNAPDQRGA
jgi:hypothetical protein